MPPVHLYSFYESTSPAIDCFFCLSPIFSVCLADGLAAGDHKLLYVAEPGIRDYLEYGGHGLLVFDIDRGHRFIRRIPTGGLDEKGKPLNVKGICANALSKRIYITTTRTMLCLDLLTDKLLWEKAYDGGCDRLALSPDGKTIYVPSLEGEHWNVVDAMTGAFLQKIVRKSGAHNTIFGLDGAHVYLAGSEIACSHGHGCEDS